MTESFSTEGVRGFLHRPAQSNGDALVLTHGAGSNCQAPLLVKLAEGFADAGYLVLLYDLPFRQDRAGGSPFPAGQAKDREGIARAVDAVRPMVTGRLFAGGHSYGGRQTTMLASERGELADALLLLSYPLHPPKKPDQMRTAHFPQLRVRSLFVHGSSDSFGSFEEMAAALELIPARTDLLKVQGSGHDLKNAPKMFAEIERHLQGLTK